MLKWNSHLFLPHNFVTLSFRRLEERLRDEGGVRMSAFVSSPLACAASSDGKKETVKSGQAQRQVCVEFLDCLLFSIRGWFYKDRFIGSEPNEKLKKKLKKKPKVIEDDAPPLPHPPSLLL